MPTPLTHDDPVTLGTYRLVARLGSGGMGTVYLARSPGGRTVALKTMHARIASEPAFRTRFRLEADAARVIGGQFGAQVMDADALAETPWLATEYVIGPPLDEAVELAGPLPEPSVRALGAALCMALGQLHRSDVVHRDLKPSNIMVTAYGPKVIDFGIARAIGDDRLTHTGAAVGTPAFMSPEQATGKEHTPEGDVFALAGVLVFAATGSAPFGHGQAADLLYRVRYTEPDLTRVPPALVPILSRCLAKDPALRPTTAQLAAQLHDGTGDFAEHLPDVLLAEIARRATEVWQVVPERLAPPESDVASEPTEGPAEPSRRRMLALWGGVGIAAAAGAGVWGWREWGDPADHSKPAAAAAQRTRRKPVWKQDLPDLSSQRLPLLPYVIGDKVLFAGDIVTALNVRTGREIWTGEKSGRAWQTAVDGDTVYQLVDFKDDGPAEGDTWPLLIAALDMSSGKTGRTLARFTDVNGALEENQILCAAHGVLYLAAGRGTYADVGFLDGQKWFLQAVDIAGGRRLWSRPLESRMETDLGVYFLGAEVVGRSLVAHQETDTAARAVVMDTATGKVRWELPLAMDRAPVRPAVDARHLYEGSGQMRALRLSDGKQTWVAHARGSGASFGPPALHGTVLYAVEEGTGLVAFDARNGRRLWSEKGDDGAKADLSFPPVIGTRYAYYRRGADVKATDLSTHETAFTYEVKADRFVADPRSKMIVAVGEDSLFGLPLQ